MDVFFYAVTRQVVNLWEYLFVWRGAMKRLRQRLHDAKTYQEWTLAANAMDRHLGSDVWKARERSGLYDYELVRKVVEKLRRSRAKGDVDEIMRVIAQGGVKPNLGGVENKLVYSQAYNGTKMLIDEYVREVATSLRYLATHSSLSPLQKYEFFKNASKTYGQTALCLSGGATFGYYHLGVIKSLLESGMLPQIFTGTSAGSLIAAMVCVRTDEELWREIMVPDVYKKLTACEDSWWTRLNRFYEIGAIFDAKEWRIKLEMEVTMGDLTFMEVRFALFCGNVYVDPFGYLLNNV